MKFMKSFCAQFTDMEDLVKGNNVNGGKRGKQVDFSKMAKKSL